MKKRAVLVLNKSIDKKILNIEQLIDLNSNYSIYGLDSDEIEFVQSQTKRKLEFITLPSEYTYDFINDVKFKNLKENIADKNNVIECLKVTLPIDKCISTFLKLDNEIWTSFLSQQEGFIHKFILQEHPYSKTYKHNELYLFVEWKSLECWKQIEANKAKDMAKVDERMDDQLGYQYQLQPIPDENGFKLN